MAEYLTRKLLAIMAMLQQLLGAIPFSKGTETLLEHHNI